MYSKFPRKCRTYVYFFPQAQYDAAEMITQRETVSHKVSESLIERAASFGIMLDDISLVSLLVYTLCSR